VPANSVISRDSNAFVFVLNGIRASMQAVVTGYRGDDFVEVLSGVKSGDKIIVKGAGFLKDGDVVQVGE
jgi:HlyD family secretion protein